MSKTLHREQERPSERRRKTSARAPVATDVQPVLATSREGLLALQTPQRAAAVAALQRGAGNAAVTRMIAGARPLARSVGRPGERCPCGGTIGPDGECDRCRAARASGRAPGYVPQAAVARLVLARLRSSAARPSAAAAVGADEEAKNAAPSPEPRAHGPPAETIDDANSTAWIKRCDAQLCTVQRQPAGADTAGRGDDAAGGEAECATRCGGIPAVCPATFCCPFPLGTATIIKSQIQTPFLLAIGAKVTASVVPVWAMWFNGGTSLQNFSSRFGTEFAQDPTTADVSRDLAATLPGQIDATQLQTIAAGAAPGTTVSLLPGLPPTFLTTTTAALEGPGQFQMDFSTIGTAPGNLAGGIGKTQTTCSVGATPSPVDDARQLTDVQGTLVRNPDGSITVTPSFSYHVVDTVDLCPGNCGSDLGVINEQQATVPMSRLEASGVSGDVPFFVDFSSLPQADFTVPPPAPPVPQNLTVSASALFEFGRDTLRSDAEATMVAELGDRPLHADLTQPYVVEGHTDSKGPDRVNFPLSESRAARVAELLERRFPNLRGHVTTQGFGATRPVAPNTIGGRDNPDGRRQNRRVELRFSAPPTP